MESKILNLEKYLDLAEKDFILNNLIEFQFLIRRDSKQANFYSQLELEIRNQGLLQIKKYRSVKEGWTNVSRPAELGFSADELLSYRPYLKTLKKQFQDLKFCFSQELKLNQIVFDTEIFFQKNYFEIVQNIETAKSCIDVFIYLIQNRSQIQGMTARQIPHGQSTKLIGKEALLLKIFQQWNSNLLTWRDVFQYLQLYRRSVEYRFYAPSCLYENAELKKFHGMFSADLFSNYDFSKLSSTLIVENLETFFQVVQWLENKYLNNILIVWGAGWRVASLTRYIEQLPGVKYYWGDIDKEGYEIYGFIKSRFPSLVSLGMGIDDLEKNKHLQQTKEKYFGPMAAVSDLQNPYEFVCRQGVRIEQEHLSMDHILALFKKEK